MFEKSIHYDKTFIFYINRKVPNFIMCCEEYSNAGPQFSIPSLNCQFKLI